MMFSIMAAAGLTEKEWKAMTWSARCRLSMKLMAEKSDRDYQEWRAGEVQTYELTIWTPPPGHNN